MFKCALQHFVGDFARLLYGAAHNLFNVTSRIHRCPQNRMIDARPQICPLLLQQHWFHTDTSLLTYPPFPPSLNLSDSWCKSNTTIKFNSKIFFLLKIIIWVTGVLRMTVVEDRQPMRKPSLESRILSKNRNS